MPMGDRSATVLVADDDSSVTASISLLLKQAGHRAITTSSAAETLDFLKLEDVDLVVQDMNFSRATTGEEGLALLSGIRELKPELPVILLTAWGSISLAVDGMKAGAADFLTKPWDNERLLSVIETALDLTASKPQPAADRETLDQEFDFGAIIGKAPPLLDVLNRVARVARTDASVLILGESGTGKELVAEAIHLNSHRADGPMVTVNLGAVPGSLFESEMFGHVRGAFTDAKRSRQGHVTTADRGTLFLDEIAELERPSQVKLLRVLQDHSFQPVGSDETRRSDFRVVSATNRDLPERVADGSFREDLYYRVNLITLHLPPLRERLSDIPLIASHHLRELRERYDLPEISISSGGVHWLQQQPWPGNVRQLKHQLERVVLLSDALELTADHFGAWPQDESSRPTENHWPPVGSMTLDEVQAMMIERAMKQSERNITRAAEALGLSRAALYRRLAKYKISE
jgi:two-component system NtrC family response regulator